MIESPQARILLLFVPLLATVLLFLIRRPSPRLATAALFAFLWQLPALLLLNLLAMRFGWWSFTASHSFYGLPVDLWMGWALWWGPVFLLTFPGIKLIYLVGLAAWVDVWLMPLLEPLVTLGSNWLWGEALALSLAFIPGLLLGRWTLEQRSLAGRVLLLMVCFTGLAFWILPSIILLHTGADWSHIGMSDYWLRSIMISLLAIPSVMGLAAVYEFYLHGEGTPIPLDPPKYLVTTGPYAYLANPMQVSAALFWLMLGVWLQSIWVATAGVMAVVFGLGLADWEERTALKQRMGSSWDTYRSKVRNWLPHWKPVGMPAAHVYIAEGCGPCQQLAFWLKCQQPVNLQIIPAQQHPERDLHWITYSVEGKALEEEGMVAIARVLEHIHLGWAWFGWMIRLPIIQPLAQLLLEISFEKPLAVCQRSSPADHSPKNSHKNGDTGSG